MHGQSLRPQTQAADDLVDKETLDLRQVQDFFWRRWKVILLTSFALMAFSFLSTLMMTPRYTAMAEILLEPRKEKIFGSENILPELNLETGNVDSQLPVIQSINLLRKVVEKEKLTEDTEFGTPRPSLLAVIMSMFRTEEAEAGADPSLSPLMLATIKRLRDALDVQRTGRTFILTIAITSEDKNKAARIANAIAERYVVDQLDARYEAARRASTWLAERMEDLAAQLRQSEEAVAKFRKENNLVATSSESKVTISEQQLSELNAKLIAARAEAAERRAKYDQAVQVNSRGGNLQAIPDVVHSLVIQDLRKQQAEVARKEADLVAHYSDQHPLVINARAERRDIERSISAEVQRILINLKNDLEVSKSREDSLQASLSQVTGQTGLDNNVGIRLRELERANMANKTLYDNFLSRAKITQEQSSFEEREARIISPATKPIRASFPKTGMIVALAGVLGLVFGIGGAVALDMLNSGFLAAREIEEKLGFPVLASLPVLSEKDRKVDDKVLDPARYLIARPLSRYAEQVRGIRVGIQMADVDHPAKVILVTSSIPDEGKSTVAQSLAFSSEKAGQRVLLIDGDLRHPSASKYFSAENKPGLVDLLTGGAAFEDIVLRQGGLTVLPAGSRSQNPPDLLGSERMKLLIEKLRTVFDYIVIDSPPLAPVIDARVLATLADKVVFVVRWRSTTREIAAQNAEFFVAGHKLAGIALNLVDESQTPRYGAYTQYSGYYYKKYYQN